MAREASQPIRWYTQQVRQNISMAREASRPIRWYILQVRQHISMAIEASCPIRWYIWLGWHLSVVWAGWMVYPRGWLKYILGSIYHQSASLLGSFLRNCIDILYSYWYTKCLPSIFCHLFPHLHLLPSITSMAILTIFLALPCPFHPELLMMLKP